MASCRCATGRAGRAQLAARLQLCSEVLLLAVYAAWGRLASEVRFANLSQRLHDSRRDALAMREEVTEQVNLHVLVHDFLVWRSTAVEAARHRRLRNRIPAKAVTEVMLRVFFAR